MHGFAQERNKILQELDAKAGEESFILNISPTGLMIFPGKEGKPLSEDELKALSDDERETLRQKSAQLHTDMNEAIRKIRKMEKDSRNRRKSWTRTWPSMWWGITWKTCGRNTRTCPRSSPISMTSRKIF
jgi:hypothetical protein